jgi:Ca2+-binding RTX toxin-like protein
MSPYVRVAALLLLAASLALPCGAQAATVNHLGNEILYQGDLTEESNAEVRVSDDGLKLDIIERGTSLQAGLGCDQVETPPGSDKSGEVACPLEGAEKLTFDMRDNDDALLIEIGSRPTPPLSVSGGEGIDLVTYTPPPPVTGVSITLDGIANDGPPDRGDNIGVDVENAFGTEAADVLAGNDEANKFFGDAGADVYSGGGGNDLLESFEPGGPPEKDEVTCGPGRDIVDGDKLDTVAADCEIVARASRVLLTNGPDKLKLFRSALSVFGRGGNDVITGFFRDRIDGGKGNDKLVGGDSVDLLTGGPGQDKLYGGSGRDTIRARDGKRDLVGCGSGRDTVQADRSDRVRPDCEKVSRR